MKNQISLKLRIKAQIRNALTLPVTVLQMFKDKKPLPKAMIKDALTCIDEIVELLKEL